jgi:hypothetical protein
MRYRNRLFERSLRLFVRGLEFMKNFSGAFDSAMNPVFLHCGRRGTLFLAIVTLAWGRPLPLHGQRMAIDAALHTSDKPYIQTTGEATVSAKPDQAVIEIGVVSQASNANASSAQNAKQTDAVLNQLKTLVKIYFTDLGV